MKTFELKLQDASRAQKISGVMSFVGEDATGSFGILHGHARMITSLVLGLARFRTREDDWQYLALPGALLYFCDNVLTVSTRRYLLDDDYLRISNALQQELLAEEEKLQSIKGSLRQMEEEILRRMWRLGKVDG